MILSVGDVQLNWVYFEPSDSIASNPSRSIMLTVKNEEPEDILWEWSSSNDKKLKAKPSAAIIPTKTEMAFRLTFRVLDLRRDSPRLQLEYNRKKHLGRRSARRQRPPYTMLIQLTIRKGDGTLKIQRLPYVTKLQEALKTLNLMILEGRQLLLTTSALNIFWPILEPSSYPLKILTLMEARQDQEAIISQNKIAREAQRLILHNHYYTFQLWARVLNNLPNQHIELKCEGRRFDDDGFFLGLVENWLQDGRPVGAEFLFGNRQATTAREFLEMVQEVPGASRVEDRQINIPMDSGSMLRISYSQVLENIESLGFWTDEYATRWILKIQVGEPG